MLSLTDKRWDEMNGGYREPYNPLQIIELFEKDIFSIEAWDLIWENLHHQGDVGEASYAIIPLLIDLHKRKNATDWQLYSYVSLVIQESRRKSNPKIPDWLESDFSRSLSDLFKMAISDLNEFNDDIWVRSIIGFVLIHKGLLKYGAIISSFDESEIEELIEERLDWKENYHG